MQRIKLFEQFIQDQTETEIGLLEVKNYPKGWFGDGASHRIYRSNREFSKLYKAGFCEELNRWVPVFKSHPDIFVEVYGEIKKLRGANYCYVMVERVNTKMFESIYDTIIEDLGINDDDFSLKMSYWVNDFVSGKSVEDVLSDPLFDKLKDGDSYLYEKFVEIVELVKKMSALNTNLDLHKYQFGYSYTTDVLKCLDY
jgi:hypothetical protein